MAQVWIHQRLGPCCLLQNEGTTYLWWCKRVPGKKSCARERKLGCWNRRRIEDGDAVPMIKTCWEGRPGSSFPVGNYLPHGSNLRQHHCKPTQATATSERHHCSGASGQYTGLGVYLQCLPGPKLGKDVPPRRPPEKITSPCDKRGGRAPATARWTRAILLLPLRIFVFCRGRYLYSSDIDDLCEPPHERKEQHHT